LLESAAIGGSRAADRNAGRVKVGRLADMMALDANHIDLFDKTEDMAVDTFIFAGNQSMVSDVWSAGRHVVTNGRHQNRDQIEANYRDTMTAIKAKL